MRRNTTLSLLRDGKVALGTWLQLHSYQAARMLAAQGMFHWLLVDYEHTPVDRSTAAQILSGISDVSVGRVTPLARSRTTSAIWRATCATTSGSRPTCPPPNISPPSLSNTLEYFDRPIGTPLALVGSGSVITLLA